jgi:hypothetical protein
MALYNNNLGKFFGPSSSYMGYVFIACSVFASANSLLALTKYTNFEEAQKEMEELNGILLPDGNCQAGQTNPVKLDPLIDE